MKLPRNDANESEECRGLEFAYVTLHDGTGRNLPRGNLFANLPREFPRELVEVLAESNTVRIERIVSTGQASPEGFWYDQEDDEFVVVLQGAAELRLEGDATPAQLKPGDYVHIHRHQRHRVEWTTPEEPTVWLALFFKRDVHAVS